MAGASVAVKAEERCSRFRQGYPRRKHDPTSSLDKRRSAASRCRLSGDKVMTKQGTSSPPDAGLWKRGRHFWRRILSQMRRVLRMVLRNKRVLTTVIKVAFAIMQLVRFVAWLFRAS